MNNNKQDSINSTIKSTINAPFNVPIIDWTTVDNLKYNKWKNNNMYNFNELINYSVKPSHFLK